MTKIKDFVVTEQKDKNGVVIDKHIEFNELKPTPSRWSLSKLQKRLAEIAEERIKLNEEEEKVNTLIAECNK